MKVLLRNLHYEVSWLSLQNPSVEEDMGDPVNVYICKYVHVSVCWGNILSLKGPKDSIKLSGLGQRQVRDAWEMLDYSYFAWGSREVWSEVHLVAHQCRVSETDFRPGGC